MHTRRPFKEKPALCFSSASGRSVMLNASASSVQLCAVTQRTCSSYLRERPTSHPMYSGMLELKKKISQVGSTLNANAVV